MGLKVRSPERAKAVTTSGEVTNAWVAGFPSLRAAKLRLKLLTIEFFSPTVIHKSTVIDVF